MVLSQVVVTKRLWVQISGKAEFYVENLLMEVLKCMAVMFLKDLTYPGKSNLSQNTMNNI